MAPGSGSPVSAATTWLVIKVGRDVAATETVLKQAESLSQEWTAA